MSPRDVKRTPVAHGDVLAAISHGIVGLLKEYYGRGPTRTKTYFAVSYTHLTLPTTPYV